MWQDVLKTNFRRWDDLAAFLELPAEEILSPFPLNLPRRLAAKIEKGNFEDPILRQFLPRRDEGVAAPAFGSDPVGDRAARQAPRLLRKYAGRALLVTTGACAMHCRYCFRKEFDYACGAPDFTSELTLLRDDTSLREVILSGGDPLSLANRILGQLVEALDEIPHLRRLRFHSRFPVGIPERIDPGLIEIVQKSRLQVWFVLHVNHPREIDLEWVDACRQMGVPLLNQAVLLRGVNDDLETLVELCEGLVDVGIAPYYLHQLDRVAGAAHFEVPVERGLTLMEQLCERVSGYALPTYVREEAGKHSKTALHSINRAESQDVESLFQHLSC